MPKMREPPGVGEGSRREIRSEKLGDLPALPEQFFGTAKRQPEILQPDVPDLCSLDRTGLHDLRHRVSNSAINPLGAQQLQWPFLLPAMLRALPLPHAPHQWPWVTLEDHP